MKFIDSLLAMLRSPFLTAALSSPSESEGSSQPTPVSRLIESVDPFAGALGLAILANPASVSPRY